MTVLVKPGGVIIIKEASDLFGSTRVNGNITGIWREPVHIKDLNENEADFAKEYFETMGKKVEVLA